MAADSRFGGHIVSGHVDNFGEIVDTSQEGSAFWLTLSAPPDLLELVVEKGSITLDGVSLTVAARTENTFSVSLIPTTQMDTTLLRKRPGDKINLEADVIGKYVRALLHKSAPAAEPVQQPRESRLTEEFLRRNGF